MARALLIRGMLAGFLAGLLMFGFSKIVGEPQVDRAIVFEAAADAAKAAHAHKQMAASAGHTDTIAASEPAEDGELFSRSTQSGIGLLTGVVVYGSAFGGLFALVFACALGRIGSASPEVVAVLLAAAGFMAISVIPMMIYPANPPAIGDGLTISYRTALYFIILGVSVASLTGAVVLRLKLMASMNAWNATLVTTGAYAAVILVAGLVLPGIDEVPADFPASVLWKFRVASMGLQLVMWSTLGVVFGIFAKRLLVPHSRHDALGGRMQPSAW